MRTGLKHLGGFAATALMLLTAIAWIGNSSHLTFVFVTGPGFDFVVGADDRSFIVQLIHESNGDVGISVTRVPPNDAIEMRDFLFNRWYDPDVAISGAWRYEWEPGAMVRSGVAVAYWVVELIVVVPTMIYLRFLYRRRRQPTPNPH